MLLEETVEVGDDGLGFVESVVFGLGLAIGLFAGDAAGALENVIFLEGEEGVHAFGEGFHGEGLPVLDEALDSRMARRDRPQGRPKEDGTPAGWRLAFTPFLETQAPRPGRSRRLRGVRGGSRGAAAEGNPRHAERQERQRRRLGDGFRR